MSKTDRKFTTTTEHISTLEHGIEYDLRSSQLGLGITISTQNWYDFNNTDMITPQVWHYSPEKESYNILTLEKCNSDFFTDNYDSYDKSQFLYTYDTY